jgi:hypothetical protein
VADISSIPDRRDGDTQARGPSFVREVFRSGVPAIGRRPTSPVLAGGSVFADARSHSASDAAKRLARAAMMGV